MQCFRGVSSLSFFLFLGRGFLDARSFSRLRIGDGDCLFGIHPGICVHLPADVLLDAFFRGGFFSFDEGHRYLLAIFL